MTTVYLNVTGMSCSHCENAVKSAVGSLPGVFQVEADAKAQSVKVSYDDTVTLLESIAKAIEEEGYTVKGIKEDN